MDANLTQTELDFKESPNQDLEITLDVISCCIIIVGFIGNILNAVVWFHQRGRTPTYIYFITISVSNIIYCIFYFLKYSLDTFGFLEESLEEDLCEISYDHLRYFVFHPCKEIFYTSTIFYSVGLSAERFVSITKPLQFNYLCTRARTFRIIIFLSILAVAINLPLFFEYVHEDRSGLDACRKPRKSALRLDPLYIWLYRVCLENLVKFLIPFALMFFFNVGIIHALKQSQRFRQSVSERRRVTGARGSSLKRRDVETGKDAEGHESARFVAEAPQQPEDNGRADPNPASDGAASRKRPWSDRRRHADGSEGCRDNKANDACQSSPNEPSSSDSLFAKFKSVFCRCLHFTSENQRLCFLCSCYVSIFLIFILPAVTRRGLFALRSTKEFSMLDTDELDYFRWVSYLLDALRPSTDFLLYFLVSSKFRASFAQVVTAPWHALCRWAAGKPGEETDRGGLGRWSLCGSRGHEDGVDRDRGNEKNLSGKK